MYRVSIALFFSFCFFSSLSLVSRLSISLDSLTTPARSTGFIVFTFSLSSRSFVPKKIRHSEVVLALSSRVCVGGSARACARALRRSNFITHRGRDYSQKKGDISIK